MKPASQYLEALYLDWVNNFLTVERFAEHHNITQEMANDLIDLSRKYFESLGKN